MFMITSVYSTLHQDYNLYKLQPQPNHALIVTMAISKS